MKSCSRYVGLLAVSAMVIGLVAFSIVPQAVGARRAMDVTVDVDLPSDSTGIPGGTLAVRIFAPASASDARYADGAPVLIFVPGGTNAGTLRPELLQAEDVIRIVFMFPGGTDPLVGRSSDGTYDYRGPDSITALRDVIRYAAGRLTDSLGRTIDDVVPVPVLHDDIGLLGGSNGGNIIVAVAAEHGADLAGHLRYVIQWESPVSSQIATADLGRVRLDCSGGRPGSLPAVNPRYRSYGPLTLDVDYSQLTYDAGDPLHPIFFDGTGDGTYTTVSDPRSGCQTPDLNLNGTLELNEDFPLSTFTDGVKQFYSRPVTQALADQNVFGTSWPADIATPPQADAFWDLREAVRQYPAALTNIPDLEGMVLTSVVDHVQTAPDHPHIHQAFDGWDGNGAWVKINPARDYVLEVDPALGSRTDLPDNAPNTAPADWTDAGSYAFPDGLEDAYFAAAVHEMADRAHAASTATPTPTPSPTSTPTPTATSTPPTPSPTATSTPPESRCVRDTNGNGVGDVEDIQSTASDLPCHIYLPVVARNWRRPWPTATPTATPATLNRPENPQIGLNFIRFFWGPPGESDTTTPYFQPEWIFDDFAELGVHTYRQFIKADLLWNVVEPQDDQWNFEQADAVITNPDFEPIVTLFALQYASPTPPWATNPSQFQKTLGSEARDYLETVIERYGPYVKYWEIGNEMNHWRAADPGASNPYPPNLPPSYPSDGFSPQEQGVFLAQVAAFIRERDPDAVIIMPGMAGLDDYSLNIWFAGVIEGGGTDWFDVVNYHFYPSWVLYGQRRQDLQSFLEEHGLADKPVWLTETGSTASPTLTMRTDYPNSPESQAADVFRRIIQAYGYGDSLAMWHTYIGSPDTPDNDWRLYGLRTDTAEAQPSYYAFKLLVQELIPFERVEILSSAPAGENSYRITTEAGDVKYVAWGSGSFAVPVGITQMTSVIPNADGSFTWQPIEAGDHIALAPEPVLLK